MNNLSICYLPTQWQMFRPNALSETVCVVIDVIRATTTIAAALANGASGVRPVASVAEAEWLKTEHPARILAGERHGLALPGFDFGNSPRALTPDAVGSREIILTTTNGTQALAACRGARSVLTCALVNLAATAEKLRALGPPWTIVCAGFEGDFGMDDAIVAGALAEALDQPSPFTALYRSVRGDLTATLLGSQAGRELANLGLQDDVPYCAEIDRIGLVPVMGDDGVLRADGATSIRISA